MVELSVSPENGVMTGLTGRGKSGRHVVHRRDGVVVVSLMARDAGRGGDVVVVVDVTIAALAWRHRVRASQWEAGTGVIERCIQPG